MKIPIRTLILALLLLTCTTTPVLAAIVSGPVAGQRWLPSTDFDGGYRMLNLPPNAQVTLNLLDGLSTNITNSTIWTDYSVSARFSSVCTTARATHMGHLRRVVGTNMNGPMLRLTTPGSTDFLVIKLRVTDSAAVYRNFGIVVTGMGSGSSSVVQPRTLTLATTACSVSGKPAPTWPLAPGSDDDDDDTVEDDGGPSWADTFTQRLKRALDGFSFPALPTWTWPAFPAWTWPGLPGWTWPSLPNWNWPSIPCPGWLTVNGQCPRLPSLPPWSWPALPPWTWPSLPPWSWPALPPWTWPSLPPWSWPAIPCPAWLTVNGVCPRLDLTGSITIDGDGGFTVEAPDPPDWDSGITREDPDEDPAPTGLDPSDWIDASHTQGTRRLTIPVPADYLPGLLLLAVLRVTMLALRFLPFF